MDMEYTRKTTVNSSYEGFDQSFGRVSRSGHPPAPVPVAPTMQQEQPFFPPQQMPQNNQNFGMPGPGPPGANYPMYNYQFEQNPYQQGWDNSFNQNMGNMSGGFYQQGYGEMAAGHPPPQFPQGFQEAVGNPYEYQHGAHAQPVDVAANINYSNNMGFNPNVQRPIENINIAPHQNIQPLARTSFDHDDRNKNVNKGSINLDISGGRKPITTAERVDNVGSQRKPLAGHTSLDSSEVKISEGLVTFCCDEYGFIGPEMFFSTSAVRGTLKPKEGDLVVIEAERVEGMKFQYAAKRVQVLKVKAQVDMEKLELASLGLGHSDSSSAKEKIISKPLLRNPPPPPILSKTFHASARSRSRSRDDKHRSSRDRQSHSGHRRRRSHSRSRTPDRRERKHPEETRSRYQRDSRRSMSRSRSKSAQRRSSNIKSSNGKITRKDKDSTRLDLLSRDDETGSETRTSSANVLRFMDDLNKLPMSDFLKCISDSNEKPQSRSEAHITSRTVTEVPGSKTKDLMDYNIWGIPNISEIKKASTRNADTNIPDVGSKEDSRQGENKYNKNQIKTTKPKQISIKLGFMETKNKPDSLSSASERYGTDVKTKQDLFRDHILNAKPTTRSIPVITIDDKLDSASIRNSKSQSDDWKAHGKEIEKSLSKSDGSKVMESSSSQGKQKQDYESRIRKQKEFENRIREVEESRTGKSQSQNSRRTGQSDSKSSDKKSTRRDRSSPKKRSPELDRKKSRGSKSEAEKISASLHKTTRKISPKVSLVISSDRERSRSPTEEEIREREQTLKMRELALEEESRLLKQKIKLIQKSKYSPDSSASSSSSPSGSRRSKHRYTRSRSRSPWSRSPEPSENEKLVHNLGIRHSFGSVRHFDARGRSRSPPFGYSSYRGEPLGRDAPVARRVRESSNYNSNSRRGDREDQASSAEPSLVLKLGRFLRNGVEFTCYVCGKPGHHGTVCWSRKPEKIYPEDEQLDLI